MGIQVNNVFVLIKLIVQGNMEERPLWNPVVNTVGYGNSEVESHTWKSVEDLLQG